MDRGGVKRPRSGALVESASKKKDKDRCKKKKKNKPHLSKSAEVSDEKINSLESTATADGRNMAKILSTFSKMEHSRFEAFKRVSFPRDAISRYVAHCLAERLQPQRKNHESTNPNAKMIFTSNYSTPQLQDVVVPSQEEEITTVVATLAKAYAQRLCAVAKVVAQLQQQQQQSSDYAALKPAHVLQAFYARRQHGEDPGFFLQANECIAIGTYNNTTGKEQVKRVAAVAAQEDFERSVDDYKEWLTKQLAGPKPGKEVKDKKMHIDSDSGDEEIDLDLDVE